MAEDVRVYEIVTASLSNLNNRQIGFESANDANLGWKMFGGKNGIGEITLFLGKDKAARVSTFGATGDVSIVSGSITINALSLTTAVDNQVMYGDFQQSSAFTYVNGNLGLGVTLKAWDASRSAIQVGGLGALWTATAATVGSATYISNNLYYDGTFKRIINDEVSSYSQSNGIHSWRSDVAAAADVEFTPTAIMQLNAAGFLRLGNTASTNPSYNIDVDRNWNGETIVGIANKNAGSSVKAGLVLETDSAIGWIQVFGSGASNAVLKSAQLELEQNRFLDSKDKIKFLSTEK